MIIEKAYYWFLFSFIYLIYFTYKDLTNNMLVDDRHNYFMKGATFGLLTIVNFNFWYVFILIFGTSFLGSILKHKKVLGEADINSLIWLFYGFGLLGIEFYVLFIGTFLLISTIFFILKFLIGKLLKQDYNKPIPFYPVILGSFIITMSRILFLIYG